MTRFAPQPDGMSVVDKFETPGFIVHSVVLVEAPGVDALEEAFRNRLGEVDEHEGFLGLQVWRDVVHPGRYVMVSWWRAEADFRRYMRSDAHRRSHARMPTLFPPKGGGLHRYEVIV